MILGHYFVEKTVETKTDFFFIKSKNFKHYGKNVSKHYEKKIFLYFMKEKNIMYHVINFDIMKIQTLRF